MKKRKDELAGFGIEAAIQHALTLNEEADNADMIILSCGKEAWASVVGFAWYAEFLPNEFTPFPSQHPTQYPGATGAIFYHGQQILVLPDKSLADKIFHIHDEDYQWSVSTTIDHP